MTFLPNYEDDIFISYAHNDNCAIVTGQRGWIDTFHLALERRLQVHLGTKASIWRNPALQGNEFFEDSLREAMPKVAILVSILSPSYINSEWCRREMELFSQIARDTGGMRLGNKARIFKVEKMPVPLDRHPPDLRGMTGYKFYYRDNNLPRGLSPESDKDAVEYWQRIDEVARDIGELLVQMKAHETPASELKLPVAGETRLSPVEETYDIFLSYRRQDGAAEARLIRAELREHSLRAFLDVDDLGVGYFDEALLKRIAHIPNFIAVLTPNCLDRCVDERDWLRQEIAHALKTNRRVVPIMLPGFQFPEATSLPPEIRGLSAHQSIYYSHEYFNAMISKLVRYLRQDR